MTRFSCIAWLTCLRLNGKPQRKLHYWHKTRDQDGKLFNGIRMPCVFFTNLKPYGKSISFYPIISNGKNMSEYGIILDSFGTKSVKQFRPTIKVDLTKNALVMDSLKGNHLAPMPVDILKLGKINIPRNSDFGIAFVKNFRHIIASLKDPTSPF